MSRAFISLGSLAAALCLAVVTGEASAQAVRPPPPGASAPMSGIATDANDNRMGPFYPSVTIGGRTVSAIMVSLGDRPLLVPVARAKKPGNALGLVPTSDYQRVYFLSSDCSGDGWLEVDANAPLGVNQSAVLLPKPQTDPHRAIVYVAAETHPAPVVTNSRLFNDPGTGARRCADEHSLKIKAYPVERVIELSEVYIPPYRLE